MSHFRFGLTGLVLSLSACTFDFNPDEHCFQNDDFQGSAGCPHFLYDTKQGKPSGNDSNTAATSDADTVPPSGDILKDVLSSDAFDISFVDIPATDLAGDGNLIPEIDDKNDGASIDASVSLDTLVKDAFADSSFETDDAGYDPDLLIPPDLPILSQSWTQEYKPDGACLGLFHFALENPLKNECGVDAKEYGTASIDGESGFGKARYFSGVAKFVFPLLQPEKEFTIECYAAVSKEEKPYVGMYGTIWSAQKDGEELYALRLLDGNVLEIILGNESIFAVAPSLSIDKPTHISVVYGKNQNGEGQQVRVYLNGVIQASKEVKQESFQADLVEILLGSNDADGLVGNNFKGTLDEVRYSNKARDQL